MNSTPVESKSFWKGSTSIVAGILGFGIGEMSAQMLNEYHVPYLRVILLVAFAVGCGWVLGHHYAIKNSRSKQESL